MQGEAFLIQTGLRSLPELLCVCVYANAKSQFSSHGVNWPIMVEAPVEELVYMPEHKSEEIRACVGIQSSRMHHYHHF